MSKRNWTCDNRDKAEHNTLIRLMGYLKQAMNDGDKTIAITEVVQYVEKTVASEEIRLNGKYPEMAR